MSFFKNIRNELEHKLNDFTTIEHALILEDNSLCIHRFQQIDGDSKIYLKDGEPIDEKYYELFNDAFSASIEARAGIIRFIIECLTKN